jgi:excisionase family DNA binding protein
MPRKAKCVEPSSRGNLITINQTCQRLAISRSTFYRLVHRGVLKLAMIDGRTPRVLETDLDLLISNAKSGVNHEE